MGTSVFFAVCSQVIWLGRVVAKLVVGIEFIDALIECGGVSLLEVKS
jgi:hypothetical protein